MTRPILTLACAAALLGCTETDFGNPSSDRETGRLYGCGNPIWDSVCIDADQVNDDSCLPDAVCAHLCFGLADPAPCIAAGTAATQVSTDSCTPTNDWQDELAPMVPAGLTYQCGSVGWTGTGPLGDPIEGTIRGDRTCVDVADDDVEDHRQDCVAACEEEWFALQEENQTIDLFVPCELVTLDATGAVCREEYGPLSCASPTTPVDLGCDGEDNCCDRFGDPVCGAVRGDALVEPSGAKARDFTGTLVWDQGRLTIPVAATLTSLDEPRCDPDDGCAVYIEGLSVASTDGFVLDDGRVSLDIGEFSLDLVAPAMGARDASRLAVARHDLLVDVRWTFVGSVEGERRWRFGDDVVLTTDRTWTTVSGTLTVDENTTVTLSLTATP